MSSGVVERTPSNRRARFGPVRIGVLGRVSILFVLAYVSLRRPTGGLHTRIWDKAAHFAAYGALALAVAHAGWVSGAATWRAAVAAGLAATAYGGLLELLQGLVPSRTPSLSAILVHSFLTGPTCTGSSSCSGSALLPASSCLIDLTWLSLSEGSRVGACSSYRSNQGRPWAA